MAERLIVVGRHSAVWRRLAAHPRLALCAPIAIGHAELAAFVFAPTDRVWVLAYSRRPDENTRMFERLHAAGLSRVAYVNSASTNVAAVTTCYQYPRVKGQAARDAARICGAAIVTIGLVYGSADELPAGTSAATSLDDLAACMAEADWSSGDRRLFAPVSRPFRSGWERTLFAGYGRLLRAAGRRPCLLRPLDVVLRTLGFRWYGYLYLSNRLWFSTTS